MQNEKAPLLRGLCSHKRKRGPRHRPWGRETGETGRKKLRSPVAMQLSDQKHPLLKTENIPKKESDEPRANQPTAEKRKGRVYLKNSKPERRLQVNQIGGFPTARSSRPSYAAHRPMTEARGASSACWAEGKRKGEKNSHLGGSTDSGLKELLASKWAEPYPNEPEIITLLVRQEGGL